MEKKRRESVDSNASFIKVPDTAAIDEILSSIDGLFSEVDSSASSTPMTTNRKRVSFSPEPVAIYEYGTSTLPSNHNQEEEETVGTTQTENIVEVTAEKVAVSRKHSHTRSTGRIWTDDRVTNLNLSAHKSGPSKE